MRHRKKRPATHSTNACRVLFLPFLFLCSPSAFPSDRIPSEKNLVSFWTRVGGMSGCRDKVDGLCLSSSWKHSSLLSFASYSLRIFFHFYFWIFLNNILFSHSSSSCARTEKGRIDRGCPHLFLSSFFHHPASNFPRDKTSTTNIHGWPSRWPEQ